ENSSSSQRLVQQGAHRRSRRARNAVGTRCLTPRCVVSSAAATSTAGLGKRRPRRRATPPVVACWAARRGRRLTLASRNTGRTLKVNYPPYVDDGPSNG